MKDADDIREDCISDLLEGKTVGGYGIIHQVSGIEDLIDFDEALCLCEASIDQLLDIQVRVRERATVYAKQILDSARGRDALNERLESAREDHDEYEPTI